MRRTTGFGALVALLLATPWSGFAHDVPDNVSIRAFLKPSGGRLQALVRVPVKALIDVEFPQLPGTDYLDLSRAEPAAATASRLWVSDFLTLYEGESRLTAATVVAFVLSRETDPSFDSYAGAVAHVKGPPLPASSFVAWDRAVLDVLLETPIHSDRSDFSILPRWGRLGIRVIATLGFLPPGGGIRLFEYEGDPAPYKLNPEPGQAAWHFIQLGLGHILNQTDHLLFLLCLILLFGGLRALVPFLAIFTLAHSFTLIASGWNIGSQALWIPPLVGALMSAAIIYMGIESIFAPTANSRRRIAAILSGLIFGLGFRFDLQPVLQFGGAHSLVSVLSFNAGLEIGQCLAVVLFLPAVNLYSRVAGPARINVIILAGLTVHMAWHRMAERATVLRGLPVQWPAVDTAVAAQWLFGAATAAGLAWLASAILRHGKTARSDEMPLA